MAFIEAYVTNLGKYNEGELASEPLKFPTTTEEVQALLNGNVNSKCEKNIKIYF